ncbi:MAG: ribonuclease HI family protein [Bacillota bacterium]
MKAILFTDGGSRGNPGPAGCGWVLLNQEGEVLTEGCHFLGLATNNVAEYTALIKGLAAAQALGVTELVVKADSELMIRQLNGIYKVKNEGLKPLFARVQELARSFPQVTYQHIPRELNQRADALANQAMDRQASFEA